MQPIKMLELYTEYLSLKDEIDTAIQEVLKSSQFIKTGAVLDFEKNLAEYLKTNVITCGNGTDALQIALMALNLQPGDEIITTPFTFVSTAEVAVLLGLKPVFIDVDRQTFNIDPSKIEEAITAKTKAIIPVHLFGQSADLESIQKIAQKHNLHIVEDACQAFGTEYIFKDGSTKKAGTVGTIGCNSFFPSKNLGAFGDGGAIYANDGLLANRIRSIANHGMKEKYQYEQIGVNSRLDSIQAAVLNVKLKYFEKQLKTQQEVAAIYDAQLKEISELEIPARVRYSSHSYHQYTVKTKWRNELQQFLKDHDIPSMVYYPRCLHQQKAFKLLGYKNGDFPVSEELSKSVLSLPIHPNLSNEQVEYITKTIHKFFNQL